MTVPNKDQTATYEAEREVRTYLELLHGSRVLHQKAGEQIEGSYWLTMSSLLLTAFTFEAYLNHVGQQKIKFWEEIDTIRVMDKFAVLCKHFDIDQDKSRRPYQTLVTLFKFRNAVAHGKSQIIKESRIVGADFDPRFEGPRTQWEEYCTPENATRAIDDVSEVLEWLHSHSGIDHHVFISGMTLSSVSPVRPNYESNQASSKKPA